MELSRADSSVASILSIQEGSWAMTQLERLGIWAAKQAREEVKKNILREDKPFSDPQRKD
jgi:hypothetical protein